MQQPEDKNMEEKILVAAEHLFLQKGFDRASTTQIAKLAGCNQALVHYYFRTKEKLFQSIFSRKLELFYEAFNTCSELEANFEDKLKYLIEEHFNVLKKFQRLPLLIFSDMVGNSERIKLIKESLGGLPANVIASLQKDIDAEVENGNIRKISALDLMLNILSLNIFTFLAAPFFMAVFDIAEDQQERLFEQRKQNAVETILSSLRP